MRKKVLLAAILAAPLVLAGTGVAISHGPGGQGYGGWGSWGMGPGMTDHGMMHRMMHGMMGAGTMGPGMMGPGMMGPGIMGPGYGAAPDDGVDLSVVDVRKRMERWLAMTANSRLKVGDVKKQDDNIIADIVTREGSLVDRYRIDRRTGATRRMP